MLIHHAGVSARGLLAILFFWVPKMSINLFCTNVLNTPRSPGHSGKVAGTSQVPPFEVGKELFDPCPFAWKTRQSPDPKVNIVLFFLAILFLCNYTQEWCDVHSTALNESRAPGV